MLDAQEVAGSNPAALTMYGNSATKTRVVVVSAELIDTDTGCRITNTTIRTLFPVSYWRLCLATEAMNNNYDEEEQLATINRSSHHQWQPKALIHRFSSLRTPYTVSLMV